MRPTLALTQTRRNPRRRFCTSMLMRNRKVRGIVPNMGRSLGNLMGTVMGVMVMDMDMVVGVERRASSRKTTS